MSNIAVGNLKGDFIWLDNRLLEMTFQKFYFESLQWYAWTAYGNTAGVC